MTTNCFDVVSLFDFKNAKRQQVEKPHMSLPGNGSCVKISLQVAAYGYLPWINFSAAEKEMQSQHSGLKCI